MSARENRPQDVEPDAGAVRFTVRASRRSGWLALATTLVGFGIVVICWLLLSGRIESNAYRTRGVLNQLTGLVGGAVMFVCGALLLVYWLNCRSSLIKIDGSTLHVRTARGAVEIDVRRVQGIAIDKHERLIVVDDGGRRHIPLLQPESTDWRSVADRLNRALSMNAGASPTGHSGGSGGSSGPGT